MFGKTCAGDPVDGLNVGRPRNRKRVFGRRAGLGAAGLGAVLVLAVSACGSGSSSSSVPAANGSMTMTSGAAGSSMSASGAAGSGASTAGAAGSSTSADTVVIKNFMFSPMSLSVAPGAVVTVRNEDSVTHTLTDKADPKVFSTGNVGPGQSKTFKAPDKAGSYAFICSIHQYMTGTIVVR